VSRVRVPVARSRYSEVANVGSVAAQALFRRRLARRGTPDVTREKKLVLTTAKVVIQAGEPVGVFSCGDYRCRGYYLDRTGAHIS
jgi:ribose 1,5-bisphosphokinase PhnN